MKMPKLLVVAGLMVATLGVSTSASARDYRGNDRHHDQRYDRHNRYDRNWHSNRGNRYGWNHRVRCHTEWRHHHRVRVCR